MTEYEVIDNFLPQQEFEIIRSTLMELDPIHDFEQIIRWTYSPIVANMNDDVSENWKYFYMIHFVFFDSQFMSIFGKKLIPILRKLETKAIMRIKCNLYPNSEKVHEHEMHVDYPYSHKGAIFSVNTCNGYTKLEDGTKIDSVANRILLFDPSKPHGSTTTSDTTVRVNINFNYF